LWNGLVHDWGNHSGLRTPAIPPGAHNDHTGPSFQSAGGARAVPHYEESDVCFVNCEKDHGRGA
jgi:hypothetical protein